MLHDRDRASAALKSQTFYRRDDSNKKMINKHTYVYGICAYFEITLKYIPLI
jgi:hypothetical protein